MVIGAILVTGASLTASLLVVQVAVLPLVFKYSKSVQRKMVFSNCINYPRNLDYDNPSSCNVVGGRNFNIEFKSKADNCPIKLGVWHIVPCSMFRDVFVIRGHMSQDSRLQEELKKTRNTVVLYCHGNSNHRASPHRLQMYKVFQALNFHVITFDYRGIPVGKVPKILAAIPIEWLDLFFVRGYGDSTRVRPTERGVVEDAFNVYAWLMDSLDWDHRPHVILWGHSLVISNHVLYGEYCICLRSNSKTFNVYAWLMDSLDWDHRPHVILWGHSLGTAVVSNMAVNLNALCLEFDKRKLPPPDALVLEAPFNNLHDEIESHPFSKLVSWLPYYKDMFVKPFTVSSEYAFTTDQYLRSAPTLPILILHSKGDKIVPYDLAVKLHSTIAETRVKGGAPLVFHTFDRSLELGHNNLCEAPNLKEVVTDFLREVIRR